jgi:hypothetical protein
MASPVYWLWPFRYSPYTRLLLFCTVDQSKRGREERELLRKREASAKKIQSAFRAFRQLRVTQRQVQSSWVLKDLNLATFTRDNLAQAIREYLFFRPSAPNDFTSLDRILTFLSISVAVNGSYLAFLYMEISTAS